MNLLHGVLVNLMKMYTLLGKFKKLNTVIYVQFYSKSHAKQ